MWARPHLVESTSGSRDLQMVKIELRVLTKSLPEKLPKIYRTLGENVKAVVAQYNASKLITQRKLLDHAILKIGKEMEKKKKKLCGTHNHSKDLVQFTIL